MITSTVGAASQEAVVALVRVFIRGYDARVTTYTRGQYPTSPTV